MDGVLQYPNLSFPSNMENAFYRNTIEHVLESDYVCDFGRYLLCMTYIQLRDGALLNILRELTYPNLKKI